MVQTASKKFVRTQNTCFFGTLSKVKLDGILTCVLSITFCLILQYFLQVRPFYEKRMGQEVEGDTLGDEVGDGFILLPND